MMSSSVVQAVLTEDDIIDKELTWAAMTRKVHQYCSYVGNPGTRGSIKTRNYSADVNDDLDWTRDDHDRVRLQRQQDRIQLQLQQQQQEQPRQRQQLRTTTKRQNAI
jgi:hypothetical protein